MFDRESEDDSIDVFRDNASSSGPNGRREVQEPSAATLCSLLAHDRRRHLLSYLSDHSNESVFVDEVVDAIITKEQPGSGPATHRERVAIDLHHVHLPKLADSGLIDFDPVEERVQYDGSGAMETLLDVTESIEEE